MDMRTRITAASERVFDETGFAASGMDLLTSAAGVSTRTLYKHFGSKQGLVAAVLARRHARFESDLVAESVDGLFAALAVWVDTEGPRGCLFLRARGEGGIADTAVLAAVDGHKQALRALVDRLVAAEAGENALLAEQIAVLYEGATAAAVYRGRRAVEAAREAAATLMAQARSA